MFFSQKKEHHPTVVIKFPLNPIAQNQKI